MRLLERDREVTTLRRALAAAAEGRGTTCLIEGPPGIGKTSLLRAAAGLAEESGVGTATAAGAELEREFGFGVVRALLERRVDGVPLTAAAAAALGRGDEGSLFGALHGLYWLVATLAEDRPLLLAVDDAQWADDASLRWLAYVARRIEELPVVLAIASRSGRALTERDALAAIAGDPATVVLRPAPLGEAAIATLLPRPELAAAVRTATGGNPFMLAELVRGGVPDTPDSVAALGPAEIAAALLRRIDALGPDARALAAAVAVLGRAEERHDAAALAHLDPAAAGTAADLLADAGVLVSGDAPHAAADPAAPLPPGGHPAPSRSGDAGGRPTPPRPGDAGAHPAPSRPGDAGGRPAPPRPGDRGTPPAPSRSGDAGGPSRPGGAAGHPTPSRPGDAGGAWLAFAHPIARQAVYQALPAGERGTLHARAARVLRAPDAVAAHLVAAPPHGDAWAVARLREAAQAAAARGAPAEAAALLRRALREPPEDRAGVLAELAAQEATAGDPAALEHLAEAREHATAPALRAQLGLTLGRVLLFAGQPAQGLAALTATAAELGPESPRELRLGVAAELLAVERVEPGARGRAPAWCRFDPDELSGATPAERALLANVALLRLMAAAPAELATGLARRALHEDDEPASPTALNAVTVLMLADDLVAADAALEHARADAQRRGDSAGYAAVLTFSAQTAFRRGDLTAALAEAREALDHASANGQAVLAGLAVAFVVDGLLELGAHDEAAALLTQHGFDRGELTDQFHLNAVLERRGRLRAARGHLEPALDDLLELGRRRRHSGIENPAFGAWRSQAALVLGALGRTDEARALAEEEHALATAAGLPRGRAVALRTLARLAGPTRGRPHAADAAERGDAAVARRDEAVGRGDDAVARLRAAAALAPDGLLEAHVLTDLGAALRAAGQRVAAREPLRRALALADERGAVATAARAREELHAAGARPRTAALTGAASLTPAELRCARHAAAGLSNREIAQALFVSVRAVEMHLTAAYRKLGIGSRRELDGALD